MSPPGQDAVIFERAALHAILLVCNKKSGFRDLCVNVFEKQQSQHLLLAG